MLLLFHHYSWFRLSSYLKYAAKTRTWLTFPKTQITNSTMDAANRTPDKGASWSNQCKGTTEMYSEQFCSIK